MSRITGPPGRPPEVTEPVEVAGRRRRVSRGDVAAYAGVSHGTVSHVLNHPDRVRPATRERVEAAQEAYDKLQAELQARITDGNFMSGVFGGVLGAGKAVLSGFFSFFTVLVLTLYFLASLPRVKQAAYGMVPASRRRRVTSLSEEILRRVGSYAIGQVAVAAINATASWIMMTIVGIPYAAVLAVAVGVVINFTPIDPIKALFWSAVINGVVAVPVMIMIMHLSTHRAAMGDFRLPKVLSWMGWLATAVMALAAVGMFATLGHG